MTSRNIIWYKEDYYEILYGYNQNDTIYYMIVRCINPGTTQRISGTFPVLFNSLSEFKQANPELFV